MHESTPIVDKEATTVKIKEYISTTTMAYYGTSRQVNSVVLTAVASTMMSIEFVTPTPMHQYIQTQPAKAEHLALENLRNDKDHIIVNADNGVALVVMDKTEYITKCEAILQDNSVFQHLYKDTSPTIHKELITILQD